MTVDSEREKNRKAFEADLARLLKDHAGKYALFQGGTFVDAFDSMDNAYVAGLDRYGLDGFYIGHIVEQEPPAQLPAFQLGLINGSLV